jgi:hypothetical protein
MVDANVERTDEGWSQPSGDCPEFVWRVVVGVLFLWCCVWRTMT